MDELDPDEIAFLLFAAAVTLAWLCRFFDSLAAVPPLRPCLGRRVLLAALPLLCAAGVLGVLQTWADPQVRGHPLYLVLFLCGEGLWLAATHGTLRLLGIDPAADVLDRTNPAALAVVVGAMLAATLVYAGANVGEGPTIWTTLVPAAVATLGLAALWAALASVAGTFDAIMIDRDPASGLRAAAALVAAGLVLGRAAAGRFTDWTAAFRDLAAAVWPTLAIALAAAVLQWALGPTAQHSRPAWPARGALPAAALLAMGVIAVLLRPSPLDPSRW